jgi:hypothetical protein
MEAKSLRQIEIADELSVSLTLLANVPIHSLLPVIAKQVRDVCFCVRTCDVCVFRLSSTTSCPCRRPISRLTATSRCWITSCH